MKKGSSSPSRTPAKAPAARVVRKSDGGKGRPTGQSAPAPARTRIQAATPAQADTKILILDVAENLFADRGIDATSIRDITQAAGLNLGSVNYHFGSKDGLIVAVFSRGLAPLNRKRLALLDEAVHRAGRKPLALEDVLRAFIRPSVEHFVAEDGSTLNFLRLLCRCFLEPHPQLATLLEDHFRELFLRFSEGFLRAVPDLPPGELFWRMTFMFGSVHQALDTWVRFETNPFTRMKGAPAAAALSRAELVARLVTYSTAGFRGAPRSA